MFEGAEAKSRRFAEHYARVAQERGCAFLDTGQVIVSSDLDGIHLEAGEQEKLGVAVAEKGGERDRAESSERQLPLDCNLGCNVQML